MINPIHYKIRLEPDLKRFQFSGHAEVQLDLGAPVDEIHLNVLDINVQRCQVKINESLSDCIVHVDIDFSRRPDN